MNVLLVQKKKKNHKNKNRTGQLSSAFKNSWLQFLLYTNLMARQFLTENHS